MPDHVHMMIPIPPSMQLHRLSVTIKGKKRDPFSRQFSGKTRNYGVQHFWREGTLPLRSEGETKW